MKNSLIIISLLLAQTLFANPGKVEVVDLKAQDVVVKVTQSPDAQLAQNVSKTIAEVSQYLAKNKIKNTGSAFFHVLGGDTQSTKFAAGFPVDKKLAKKDGDFEPRTLPAGKAVKLLHTGSYANITESYKSLKDWMAKNNKKKAGLPWEVYLTSADQTNAAEQKTEIYFPIK